MEREQHEVVLREPEYLLKTRLGNDVNILDFQCEPLVKIGDNYGSTICRVNVKFKRSGDCEIKKLNIVAKMLPPTDFQRTIFESQFTFKKEIFLYEDLVPTYRDLLPGGDFDVIPGFYGARLSRINGSDDVDEDAVILLENLRCKGYYMVDRLKGLDKAHTNAALKALAKFHAIGLSVKHKKPSYLSSLRKYGKPMSVNDDLMGPYLESTMRSLREDLITAPYAAAIRSTQSVKLSETYYSPLEADHEWACIIHGDFWTNNMLFKSESGDSSVKDARILDFQTFYLSSPLADLLFFLCTSMEPSLKGFNEAIETYRLMMIEILEQLGCDTEFMSEKKFNERLKIDAHNELIHIVLMVKVVELRDGENLENDPANEACMRRIHRILELYLEKKWI